MSYTLKFQGQAFKVELEEDEKQISVEIDGKKVPVEFQEIEENLFSIIYEGQSITLGVVKKGHNLQIFLNGDLYEIESVSERDKRKSSQIASGMQEIKSPMPSRVVKMLTKQGAQVELDEGVVVVEAMKMESELKSPIKGEVKDVFVKEGDAVEAGTVLLVVSSE